MMSVDETNASESTYKFNVNVNMNKEFPSINRSLNRLDQTNDSIMEKSIRIPSKNLHLEYGSAMGSEKSSKNKVHKLPQLPERYQNKKNSLLDQRLGSNDTLSKVNDNFISQKFTLDPNSLAEAAKAAIRENKNLSFNFPDSSKVKEAPSERSELQSRKMLSARSLPMPKVSPFTKSIPIKKHGMKLFTEDDAYL